MKLATSTSAATNYTRKVPTVVTYSAHLIMKPLTTHTPTTTSINPTMDPSPISDGGRNGTVLHRTSTAVYVVVFTLWTVMVAAGLLLIFSGRRQKAIRIRDWVSTTLSRIIQASLTNSRSAADFYRGRCHTHGPRCLYGRCDAALELHLHCAILAHIAAIPDLLRHVPGSKRAPGQSLPV